MISLIVRVDFGLGSIKSESNKSRDDDPIVLDWGFGVLRFVGVLIWDFWEVNFADVEPIGDILEGTTVENSAVD